MIRSFKLIMYLVYVLNKEDRKQNKDSLILAVPLNYILVFVHPKGCFLFEPNCG